MGATMPGGPSSSGARRAWAARWAAACIITVMGSGPFLLAATPTTSTQSKALAKPQRACSTPQGEPIPASKIMKDLAEGRPVEITGRIIDGSIDADQVAPAPQDDRKTFLRVMRSRLRLESCRINGRVSLPRCLLQDVSLNCSEIVGDVDLSDSEIWGGVSLEGAHVLGAVSLSGTRVERDVVLRRAVLEDNVEIAETSLHGLFLGGAEVRRSIEITNSLIGAFELNGTKVAGTLKVSETLVATGGAATDAIFGRGVTIDSSRFKGPFSLLGAAIQGGLTISGVTIDGHLILPALLEGSLSFNDLHVYQNLVMLDGQYQDAAISGLEVLGASELTGARFVGKVVIAGSDFGRSFVATEASFEGDVEFRKVRFPGEDPMQGASFARAPSLVDTTLPRPPRVRAPEITDQPDGEEFEDEDEPDPGEP